MTRKTRLALYRVRNHARRLVQAIDALGVEAALETGPVQWEDEREGAEWIAEYLSSILEDGDDA